MKKAPIYIGLVGPMTGPAADDGIRMRDAAKAFERYINNRGGVLGRPLEILVEDDACSTSQAVSVANILTRETETKTVPAVVGHFCSLATMAARPIYHEQGMVQMTLSQQDAITGVGYPRLFRITPSNGALTAGIVRSLRQESGKMALYHSDDSFGNGLADTILKELGSDNQVTREKFTPGDRDFTAIAARLRFEKIQTVFLAGGANDLGVITRQLRGNGYLGKIMTPGVGTLQSFAQTASCPIVDGVVAIGAADHTFRPENAGIVKALEEAGYKARDNILYTWSGLKIIVDAMEQAQSADAGKIAAVIRSQSFDTPQGNISFTVQGPQAGNLANPEIATYVWRCKDGVAAPVPQTAP